VTGERAYRRAQSHGGKSGWHTMERAHPGGRSPGCARTAEGDLVSASADTGCVPVTDLRVFTEASHRVVNGVVTSSPGSEVRL
jgi:hypothetical protein